MKFYDNITEELQQLTEANRLRSLKDISGEWRMNLSSNDYLGAAANNEWQAEFYQSVNEPRFSDEFNLTASSSRLLTGNHSGYLQLETELSRLYNGREALVFNSGYHANIGILPAISTAKDLILSDKLNHASIIDGLRLADAKFKRYRHNDYDQLEQLLANNSANYRQIFIITESLFSMDGDVADLNRLVTLKKRYNSILIVDEAHAVGVFGKHGAGICEAQGVIADIDIIIGTFGKALASLGAYAIINGELKNYLINKMRSLIFTTALPPAVVNWSRFVLEKIIKCHAERQHLQQLSTFCRNELAKYQITTRGNSHIIPIIIGEDKKSVVIAEKLRNEGFLVFPIRPPTVPPNSSRLRLSLNAKMNKNDLKEFIDCLCNLIG
jgi:8-amino-7-oxononanoate synthase